MYFQPLLLATTNFVQPFKVVIVFFVNQLRAWFLEIDLVGEVCVSQRRKKHGCNRMLEHPHRFTSARRLLARSHDSK